MSRLTLPCILLLLLVAACTTSTDPDNTNSSGPLLVGENALPKQLVTVQFTATLPESANTAIPTSTPTDFPEFLDPTFTPTPIVGIFVGTAVDGTPESAAIAPIAPNAVSGSGGPSVPIGATVPVVSDASGCLVPVAGTFNAVYTANSSALQALGCPVDAGQAINLVYQPFERGRMFWRDTRQIYVLQPNASLAIVPDGWTEGQPASDDAYVPPSPDLLQPVRGFGLVWRNNESLRNAIGWATQGESPIPSFWQTFDNGVLFLGDNGAVYALLTSTSTYIGPL